MFFISFSAQSAVGIMQVFFASSMTAICPCVCEVLIASGALFPLATET